MSKLLELGAGPCPQPGYETLDGEDWSKRYQPDYAVPPLRHIIDVEIAGQWPGFEDNSYDGALSIHMVEHIDILKVHLMFQEVFRILKPGAVFRVHVPNGPVIAQAYLEIPDRREALQICLYGKPEFHESHRCLYDHIALKDLFYDAGFWGIVDVTDDPQYRDRHDEGWEPLFGDRGKMSLKLIGMKP